MGHVHGSQLLRSQKVRSHACERRVLLFITGDVLQEHQIASRKIDEAVDAGEDPYELQSRAYELASKKSRAKPAKKAPKKQSKSAKKPRSKRK